ncbi:hypothetical protein DFH08DRAFT_853745 [Mycena albidolilacea]|uniref:Uncharacterized protein n=1 Tax=Mycena albidolilacea TaxID=1033008 RepID=A0AAD7ADS3_9AGAR|nr:hypothetical protein DFH08DRAFT_853745 [Mycena albidolilacea]
MNMSSSTTTPRPFFTNGLLFGIVGLVVAASSLVLPLAVAIHADGVHWAYIDMGTFALRSGMAVITLRFPPTRDSFPVAVLSAFAGGISALAVLVMQLLVKTLDLDDGVATVTVLQFAGSIASKMVLAFGSSWAAFYTLMVLRREKKEMPGWGIWLSISPSTQFPEVRRSLSLHRNRHPPHPPLQLPLAPLPPMIRKGTPLALLQRRFGRKQSRVSHCQAYISCHCLWPVRAPDVETRPLVVTIPAIYTYIYILTTPTTYLKYTTTSYPYYPHYSNLQTFLLLAYESLL